MLPPVSSFLSFPYLFTASTRSSVTCRLLSREHTEEIVQATSHHVSHPNRQSKHPSRVSPSLTPSPTLTRQPNPPSQPRRTPHFAHPTAPIPSPSPSHTPRRTHQHTNTPVHHTHTTQHPLFLPSPPLPIPISARRSAEARTHVHTHLSPRSPRSPATHAAPHAQRIPPPGHPATSEETEGKHTNQGRRRAASGWEGISRMGFVSAGFWCCVRRGGVE